MVSDESHMFGFESEETKIPGKKDPLPLLVPDEWKGREGA
jgi:hypothetical protein